MTSARADPEWEREFERWLEPFLACFRHKSQRRWAPVYLRGLLGPGRRKCLSPMARHVAPGDREQLHHFACASPWDSSPLAAVLVSEANGLVGGEDAHLIVDDTALVKKGRASPGVGHQYCGELGKKANCQSLVSLTLARREVPVVVGLRLFLPEAWDADAERRRKCGIPREIRHQPKWRVALEEIDRVMEQGAEFGDVLADAGYGVSVGFRRGLNERDLTWTVGVTSAQKVYPADVEVSPPGRNAQGRPRKHGKPSCPDATTEATIDGLGARALRSLTWRRGTKGPLRGRFAMARVRVADGAKISQGRRLPGQEAWLICEKRAGGERRYYFSNRDANTSRIELARTVKARWVCEQPHQQMKQELGLDDFEGRTWLGLQHHALMTMIAFLYLQHLRLKGKKNSRSTLRPRARACPRCDDA